MTVQSEVSKVVYNGNGSTTVFSTVFYFTSNADVKVVLVSALGVEVLKSINTHYTISGADTGGAGTVTMITSPASGEKLILYRDPPVTQLSDYIEGDEFPAEAHEEALDKLTHLIQRNRTLFMLALSIPEHLTGVTTKLPIPEAGKYLKWNSDASAINYDTPLEGRILDATYQYNSFIGDGLENTFECDFDIEDQQATLVIISGVLQHLTSYSISGNDIVFPVDSPPPLGVVIEVRHQSSNGLMQYDVDYFTSDGVTTIFHPDFALMAEGETIVSAGGVIQHFTEYSITPNSLNFVAPLPSGVEIELRSATLA